MVAVLPLTKLGTLAIRTISKPISGRLKETAKRSPRLSRTCYYIGQGWHNVASRVNIRLLGHKIKSVKPLGEAEAIDTGATFIGEAFIYSVSAGAIFFELWRSDAANEKKLQEKLRREREEEELLTNKLQEYDKTLQHLREELAELKTLVEETKATAQDRPVFWSSFRIF